MPKFYTPLFIFLLTSFMVSAQQLVSGKATLEKIDNRVYTISKIDSISKTIDLDSKNKNNIKGVLAVLFEDCGAIRDEIFATEYFDEKTLVKYTSNYNNCDYSDYTPSEKELESVNSKKFDRVRFFGGVDIGLKNISFFDSDETEVLNQYGATIGILGSPVFMGQLQGNLYFSLQTTMTFGGEKTFKNSPEPTSFSVNTFRLIFGTEYYFNKNEKLKPFLGIGFGLTSDSYKGTLNNSPFKIGSGNPIWNPKIGLLYGINDTKDIGITISYISEYTDDLSFPNSSGINRLIVNSSYYNFNLYFYF